MVIVVLRADRLFCDVGRRWQAGGTVNRGPACGPFERSPTMKQFIVPAGGGLENLRVDDVADGR